MIKNTLIGVVTFLSFYVKTSSVCCHAFFLLRETASVVSKALHTKGELGFAYKSQSCKQNLDSNVSGFYKSKGALPLHRRCMGQLPEGAGGYATKAMPPRK